MKLISDSANLDNIWNAIYTEFKFNPQCESYTDVFDFSGDYMVLNIATVWDENQEKFINNIFKEMSSDDIYALVWQHDCFEFNPNENIEYNYQYYDASRNEEVSFPNYYPDGEYNFFISKDFSYGIFLHPWLKRMYVWGDELINKIETNMDMLGLKSIYEEYNLKLIENFPELNSKCEEMKNLYEEEWKVIDSFFVYGNVFLPFFIDNLEAKNDEKLKQIFDFIEMILEFNDKYIDYVIISVFENIKIKKYLKSIKKHCKEKTLTIIERFLDYNRRKNIVLICAILLLVLLAAALILTFSKSGIRGVIIGIISGCIAATLVRKR